MHPLFILLVYTAILPATPQKLAACPQNCRTCSPNSTFCNACHEGYEPTHIGQCLVSSTVDNCQLYGVRDTCIICKPTFRLLLNNTCSKMSDGCLIAGPTGTCSKCMEGSVRTKLNQCSTRLLNCLRTNSNMECILCQMGYRLQNGKCMNYDLNCQYSQPNNGLCMLCKPGYKLLEYRCVRNEQLPNCYLVSSDFQTCYFCKIGYESYFGKCFIQQDIEAILYQGANKKKCNAKQYYNTTDGQCYELPFQCQKFDYGFMRCVSCLGTNIMLAGLCRDPALTYCLIFDPINPYNCLTCQRKYYLTSNKLCQQFPIFCDQVSNQQCVKCIDLFLLNSKGQCEDPNCEMLDSVTSVCLKCKVSYVKNSTTGICTFEDINCVEKGANSSCLRCRDNYIYNQDGKVCKFRDPQCKIFSQKQVCLECRTNFYVNTKTNICMQLPFKCLSADQEGNCQYCSQGYALMNTHECMLIVNISNCQRSSPANPKVCQKCKDGFYKDEKDVCLELPIYCQSFDPVKRVCVRCNRSSTLKNGLCFDNFCQYFGEDAECLGCKSGYQYGPKGECIPEKTDPNCKQFLNGQCRVCSDRYYFNSQWKCTNVSTLCRNYDQNNGECTSCYPGYALEDGVCIRQTDRVICVEYLDPSNRNNCTKCNYGYVLNAKDGQCYYNQSGCIRRSVTTRACLKCLDTYVLDEGSGYCLKVANASQYQTANPVEPAAEVSYNDPNCVVVNENKNSCQTCISRMFYSLKQNKCSAVDPNCRTYTPSTGQCTQCYDGYNVTADGTTCQLSKPLDKNCKVFANNVSNECSQCYSGYYYDRVMRECVIVDTLCRTVDTANGNCLSCWEGYGLVAGRCVIDNSPHPDTVQVINTNANANQYCLDYNFLTKTCLKCAKSTVFDTQLQSCERPLLGVDENCLQYQNRVCVRCKSPYFLKSKYCVLGNV